MKIIDENGSLKFQIDSSAVAPVEKRIPTEAEFLDDDGVMLHVLLHVVSGKLNELEIYKEDSSQLKAVLKPEKLSIVPF